MKQLTSVKVEEILFQNFKEEAAKSRFSLQKLTDRALYLYLTDEEFKQRIHAQTDIQLK